MGNVKLSYKGQKRIVEVDDRLIKLSELSDELVGYENPRDGEEDRLFDDVYHALQREYEKIGQSVFNFNVDDVVVEFLILSIEDNEMNDVSEHIHYAELD